MLCQHIYYGKMRKQLYCYLRYHRYCRACINLIAMIFSYRVVKLYGNGNVLKIQSILSPSTQAILTFFFTGNQILTVNTYTVNLPLVSILYSDISFIRHFFISTVPFSDKWELFRQIQSLEKSSCNCYFFPTRLYSDSLLH